MTSEKTTPSPASSNSHLAEEGKLDLVLQLYEFLSHSSFSFVSAGTEGALSIDSYLFSSINCTLRSVTTLADQGQLGDAYALARRYFDLLTVQSYSALFLQHHFQIGREIVPEINDWVRGVKKLPSFKKMSHYIRTSHELSPVVGLLEEHRYLAIRNRCNDQMHYNAYWYAIVNDGNVMHKGREQAQRKLFEDLVDLCILHICCVTLTTYQYLASSDYLDSLECGLRPEPDSQYWVAPIVQEAFDAIVRRRRPDIAKVLVKEATMHLR